MIARTTAMTIGAPSFQSHCNLEGFNAQANRGVRIGIIGNNETDCVTADSVIGIGLTTSTFDPTRPKTGNNNSHPNVDIFRAMIGYVMIR